MARPNSKVGKSGKAARQARRNRLKVQERIYDEVQCMFQFHDDANTSLDKKAQNLMIASALVGTLFLSVATASDPDWMARDLWWLAAVAAFSVTMAVTVVLCISINLPRSQPAPIVGGRLLCCGRLHDKTYEELVAGGEDAYYRSRIEEYALAMTKQARINKKKAGRLSWAYAAFGSSLVWVIMGLLVAYGGA